VFQSIDGGCFHIAIVNDLLRNFHALTCDLIRPGKRGNSCVFHDHVEMKRNRATRLGLPASCACDGVATSMIKTGRVHANVKFRLVISEKVFGVYFVAGQDTISSDESLEARP